MVASSSMPLFPHLAEMNDEEKYSIIARFIPCDRCSQCTGWHPYDSSNDSSNDCQCGHDTFHHIDNGQDLDRRLKVALRLTELLEEKGKIEDYDYEDEDILSLKKQILYNALPESDQASKRSRDLVIAEEEEEEEEDHDSKRPKTKDKDNHFESEEEEEDTEEEEESDEEELDSDKSDDEEEEDDEDEDEDEEEDEEEEDEIKKDSDNLLQTKDDQVDTVDLELQNIMNGLDFPADQITNSTDIDLATEDTALATEDSALATEDNDITTEDNDLATEGNDLVAEDNDLVTEEAVTMDVDQPKEEQLKNDIKLEDTIIPDVLENGVKVNGINAEENPMIREFMPIEKKESPAMIEEREGVIQVQVVLNDGARQSMILLTGLKNIFQKQLPKMPKEYIARLVYDRNHRSIALIRSPNKVIGGICYRPFDAQEFAEIVFCAVASTEQVKGYGSFIMNHLKDYVSGHTNVRHFLTYADNYAVGYFKKQGFTTEITLDKRKWVGYIKDYEGGTIMQCTMVPKVKYLRVQDILGIQRNAILKKIQEQSTEHITYPGIRMPIGKNGKRSIDPLEVPGIAESGWTPEMDVLSNRPRHSPHYNQMLHIVEEMQNYTHAWPFLEPVSIEDVADYYDIIKDPMDLATLEENVKADAYPTMEDFIQDTQKIFENCKLYNAEDTEYARCAAKLERFFNEKLRAAKRAKNEQN